jgi:acyl phosphate:glycerol-3-phosphate acyltransferase
MYFLAFATAYIIGSIPSALWLGKLFYNKDIRNFGSNNLGATNSFRVLGKLPGLAVLIIDISKGYLVVICLPIFFPNHNLDKDLFTVILGLVVILGHIFSCFTSFKGGKGVATTLGVIIALNWPTALVSIAIFVTVFLISHYVSLGALIASFCLPFVLILFQGIENVYLLAFTILISLLVILRHKSNILRLIKGNENKMFLVHKG